jgi:PST family polysaccharide transporter/lipopolysaccharide exporter
VTQRLPFARSELRSRVALGVGVNTLFFLVVEALVLTQGLLVARILGPREIGLYGIVSITVMTLIALKRVGINEAYVQQDEPDQAQEFRRAFTLELGLAVTFSLLIAAAAPILVAVYGEPRLLALTLALTYLPIAFALQAPVWIFFRRMDFVRQRGVQAVIPLTAFCVTVPLVLSGVGVWSLVIGAAAGNLVAVALAQRLSPFRIGLSFDRATARRYLSFSWPILVVTAGALVTGQGQLLAFDLHGGLAATGYVALAVALTRYADRADQVISPSVYPAVCAVRDSLPTLEELFTAASRLAAVWAVGFGAAFVLFAPDLVELFLGPRWRPATLLLQGLAAVTALYQLGYTWIAFARGMGRPRLPALEAVVAVGAFLGLAVPGLFLVGTGAYVAGLLAGSLAVLALRARFVRRLLPGVRLGRLAARSLSPLVPAAGGVVALRLALWGGEREPAQAAVEAALFVAVYVVATWAREPGLAAEARRFVRRPAGDPA